MKPTAGFPSQTAAVLALRRQNFSTSAIAEQLGIDARRVTSLEANARRAFKRRVDLAAPRVGPLPKALLERIGEPARDRGLTPNELIRRILTAVVKDGLIDAVLDDKPKEHA